MTPSDLEFLTRFLKERSGLILTGDKGYLIEGRLTPVARRYGLATLADLVQKLRQGGAQLETDVVEAMTTNESFFFRDKVPFDYFTEVMLPALMQARASTRRIRIWCAAASTGQEPYSLAMLLHERKAQLAGWNVEILATDLSNEVITRAKAGTYSQFEVQRGLPIQFLLKYFEQKGDTWVLSDEIRQMVQFRTLNLLRDFSPLGAFDIVYCRNVLIYFDERTKVDILNRIAKLLPADGYLLLGAAETVVGLTEAFRPHPEKRALYVKNDQAATRVTATPLATAIGAPLSFAR